MNDEYLQPSKVAQNFHANEKISQIPQKGRQIFIIIIIGLFFFAVQFK